MLSHKRLWQAIDALAAREGVSTTSLARMAGLDASIFNRSKRFQPNGRPRWPSTESIARILDATQVSVESFFVELLGERRCVVWSYQNILDQTAAAEIPVLNHAVPLPSQFCWGESAHMRHTPSLDRISSLQGDPPQTAPENVALSPDERVFLFKVEDDRFTPFYKEGASLLLGLCCPITEGDRVVFFCCDEQESSIIVGDISADHDGAFYLAPLDQAQSALPVTDDNKVRLAKILWASQ
ncbi:Phage repressor protein C, contains Cro/C1-type HTH and peptisase s24 domains [Cohaesibacter marisflavi]|uniref:Phage repressor protein C, contains Cro/C1-type HTH and peptisase s24 domains n=1 Tax=Cohaesibacter marisflavi TaxID=655353 RepID=A0A1I5D955_9HYPH|nr:helix-turn-helix transcriptional regulator [Cohaesibacter marisflavi]SFN95647.1 Phage repressor protein C, contains Cro/C1-type HTH and peptisase s24 domains [Cohaesibacter marisflavi]